MKSPYLEGDWWDGVEWGGGWMCVLYTSVMTFSAAIYVTDNYFLSGFRSPAFLLLTSQFEPGGFLRAYGQP